MDITFTLSAQDTLPGRLQVGVSDSRIELSGLASGRTVTVDGVFGHVSVIVAPAEEVRHPQQHTALAIEALSEAPAQVQPEAPPTPEGALPQDLCPAAASQSLFEQLVALRKQIASEVKLPPYIIFHDATLKDMCRRLPTDLQALKDIQGVGEAKLVKYGSRFVDVIREHIAAHSAEGVAL